MIYQARSNDLPVWPPVEDDWHMIGLLEQWILGIKVVVVGVSVLEGGVLVAPKIGDYVSFSELVLSMIEVVR